MGGILTVNLDRETAEYIIKKAKERGVTPSELIRERIYERFGIDRKTTSAFPPRREYRHDTRVVFRVYLGDTVYLRVKDYLKRERKTVASFIRELFAVVLDV